MPTIEELIRIKGEDGSGVGISYLLKHTELTEEQIHQILLRLHEQGVVRYCAAEQVGGQKKAYLIS